MSETSPQFRSNTDRRYALMQVLDLEWLMKIGPKQETEGIMPIGSNNREWKKLSNNLVDEIDVFLKAVNINLDNRLERFQNTLPSDEAIAELIDGNSRGGQAS